ncbi:MAG TPA: TetR family transcriptional regulator [Chthoniobacterales bacterium]
MKAASTDTDPRVQRTRRMLHQAFFKLLAEKAFEAITVQDITERSTLNRATFYDHFSDKYALLDDIIGGSFRQIFEERMKGKSSTCPEGMKQLLLAICDFLAGHAPQCREHQRQFALLVEAKIKAVVREFLLVGLRAQNLPAADAELRAVIASWAICGAAMEWNRTKSMPPEMLVKSVLALVGPALWERQRDVGQSVS